MAAAITSGRVEIENVRLDHLTAVVEKLREVGVKVTAGESRSSPAVSDFRFASCDLRLERGERRRVGAACLGTSVVVSADGGLAAADCIALPYPGIPTDVQAQLMTLLTVAGGISVVTDKVFPD